MKKKCKRTETTNKWITVSEIGKHYILQGTGKRYHNRNGEHGNVSEGEGSERMVDKGKTRKR